MTKLTESDIETLVIELLQQQGYDYLYGPNIAPDGDNPLRQNFDEVILTSKLKAAIDRINPAIPAGAREDALRQVQRIHAPELISSNEAFHRLLTEGVQVTFREGSEERGDYVWLIDFANPSNNDFFVVNQFTVVENHRDKRPDVAIFINGLPLVVIELKNSVDETTTINSAFKQLSTYKADIPSLFTYNSMLIISDGLEAKVGTISSGLNRFLAWKSVDGYVEESNLISPLYPLIQGMLNKKTLLDLIQNFIIFEETKKTDPTSKINYVEVIKKLAAYHQYYATNKAIESVVRASKAVPLGIKQDPADYGLPSVKHQPEGDRKGGVIWHTQGSGKSLTMVFTTGKIVRLLNNPTILVITDRNDLDDQLFDTFAGCKQLLRQDPVQATDRQHLKQLLKVSSGGVIFTTIQKFQPEQGNVYEQLSDRRNIVVIADEAHRTQYGFKAKTVDDKDAQGNVIGQKLVYGFAKYMRDALPNATYLGFTGTPIEGTDVNTPAVFGGYVDVYDIEQAVKDGATVSIYYESRLAKVELSDAGKNLVRALDDELSDDELTETQQVKAKWTQLEALIGSDSRIKNVAQDIVKHYAQRQEVVNGKGMIVTMSRRIAAKLYGEIIKLKPEWHSDDLNKGVIKVVMTTTSSDGPEMSKHHTTKEQRRLLAERMKNPDDELQLVIVRDMWLTGFDAPCLHTMYLDKPMRGHNLMQAIARVNRVYRDKPNGLIVDYLGIASDLRQALSFYADSGGKGDPTITQEQAIEPMLEKLEIVSRMFYGFPYHDYFTADTGRKLALILEAEEHILGLENGRKRFIDEVTALSRAFAIAIPHEQAMDIKDEVAFFQAVKARLVKFDSIGTGKTDEELETAIRQVIDQALVSSQVVDLFDAAGIKKPDISIFTDEFMLEVKNMKHKNLAFETLKKLLNDEIKARAIQNYVQSKTLMEMLEDSIKRYHNKIITAAEVIEELISLGKDIKNRDEEPAKMGLSIYEYAFYVAVADNQSARELMGKDKLRELAVVLTEKLKKNASIDWNIKESVRAKLRVIVKRTLRQYGYPPDMALLATDAVLHQATLLANELSAAAK
jgi:type I restriction enzyme R subunit